MSEYLSTTIRNIAWFKGAFDRNELDMKPPFQRNPVWLTRQKSYLIDTILHAFPIPEIYMQETVNEEGNPKYIIVDGQQRTRAVLEYLNNEYSIDARDSPELGDLFFNDLTTNQKKDFYKYNFVIRILPDIKDDQLREIFQRLNKNVVALNKQELRQATYWGDFITTMKKISDKEYWLKVGIFSVNDVRRMLDVEYISELAVYYLHGFQNKKDNLDKFYTLYEEDFSAKEKLVEVFDTVLNEILKIIPNISDTRWRSKADFYSLFGVFSKFNESLPLSKDKREDAQRLLIKFGNNIDLYVRTDHDPQSEFLEATLEYYKGIRASTDLGSRKNRENALAMIIGEVFI